MRPLSRLLSVFIALILMGVSLVTVAAHDETATGADAIPKGEDVVSVSVELLTDNDPAYPHDELEYLVSIYRLNVGHEISNILLFAPGEGTEDDADGDAMDSLNAGNAYSEKKIKLDVDPLTSGVASRQVPLTFTVKFTAHNVGAADGNLHAGLTSEGEITINVVKRPDAESGVAELSLDFGDVPEPAIEKGAEIKFAVTVTTGKYEFAEKAIVVTRQRYDEDGDEDGPAIPIGGITIPMLGTNATTSAIKASPDTYKLSQRDVDLIEEGGSIEFAYEFVVTEADIVTDINKDGDFGLNGDDPAVRVGRNDAGAFVEYDAQGELSSIITTIAKHDKVETLEATLLTLAAAAAPAEPEATPEPYIGMNDAATIEEGTGNIIHITFADGTRTSIGVGALTTSGEILPHSNGFIRDSDLGKTYAVVRRASDGMIVRAWITSGNAGLVGDANAWAIVVTSYSFSVDVVNAIPLDGMHPADQQLVKVGKDIYVNLAGEWWLIPDIPTFESRSYYWCDVTSADDRFNAYVMDAPTLPSTGGTPTPGYPSCR